MIVQICIGSSCHIKGSYDIVEMMRIAINEYNLGDEITLAGSFCIGNCNRIGVTIQLDDIVHIGITKEGFKNFFEENILKVLSDGE